MQTASRPPIEIPQTFTDYLRSRTEIVAAYLFGSVAAGKAHKFSDVDVALLLAKGIDSKQKWDIILEAMGEAESAFGRRADVAILNTSPTVFCYLILKHGRIIFDRATTSRPEFEARVYLAYFDLKPYLAEYDAAWTSGLTDFDDFGRAITAFIDRHESETQESSQ